MKLWNKSLVVLIWSIFGYAQQVEIIEWDSVFETTADSCRPRIKGLTRAQSNVNGGLTATVRVNVDARGPVNLSNSFFSSKTSAANQNTVYLVRNWPLNLPNFGIYSIDWNSLHEASQNGVSSIPYTLDTLTPVVHQCEYYGYDDEDPNQDDSHCQGGSGDSSLGCTSPLVVDLGADGFHFGEAGSGVFFDLLGNGVPLHMQWVRAGEDDAFLVLDLNENGMVDDGSELFGNGTRLLLHNHELAPNGFVALAQYDDPALGGNDDGMISIADDIWPHLSLWLDSEADGLCQTDEMIAIESTRLHRLECIPRETRRYDAAGNWLRFFAHAWPDRGRPHRMVDVFFRLLDGGTP